MEEGKDALKVFGQVCLFRAAALKLVLPAVRLLMQLAPPLAIGRGAAGSSGGSCAECGRCEAVLPEPGAVSDQPRAALYLRGLEDSRQQR